MLKVRLSMLSKVIIVLITLSLFSVPVTAQKQVTIDRTKLAQDRNKKDRAKKLAVVKKKQEESQTARRKSSNKAKTFEQPKYTSILRVDGIYSEEITKKVSSSPRYETFNVNTDGNNWNVTFLPPWCTLSSRTNNSFTLFINENANYESRKDWLLVKSDNKQVKVYIEQDAKPINVSALINNAWIEHNIVINGTDHMVVSGSFNIINGNGLKFYAVAMIQNEYGSYLFASASYPAFKMSDGKFFAGAETKNSDNNSNIHNFRIFIPNDSFYPGYGKKHKLRLTVSLYCEKKGEFIPGVSRTIPFMAKRKKKGIQTKALW